MTAASADREAYGHAGIVVSGVVATGKTIYEDTLVGYDASGYLEPMDASGNVFAGVSMEGGTEGETIRFERKGIYEMIFSSAAITYLGDEFYAVDDQTIASSGTTKIGRAAKYLNSGSIFIDIGGYC